jgi:hypothetical protein
MGSSLDVVFVEATNEPRPRGQGASEHFGPPFEEAPLGLVARGGRGCWLPSGRPALASRAPLVRGCLQVASTQRRRRDRSEER